MSDLEVDAQSFAERYDLNSRQTHQATEAFRNAADSSCVVQHDQAGQTTASGHDVRFAEANLMSTSHTFVTDAAGDAALLVFPGLQTFRGQPHAERNAKCLRPNCSGLETDESFTGQHSSVPDMSVVYEPLLKGSHTASISVVNGAASLDPRCCICFVIHQDLTAPARMAG